MKAKKVMALMLCAAMVTSMSATAAFAAEEKEDAATEESADSTAAEDPTAQFDGLKANEAYEFPMMVKSFQSTYWDAAQEGMKKHLRSWALLIKHRDRTVSPISLTRLT